MFYWIISNIKFNRVWYWVYKSVSFLWWLELSFDLILLDVMKRANNLYPSHAVCKKIFQFTLRKNEFRASLSNDSRWMFIHVHIYPYISLIGTTYFETEWRIFVPLVYSLRHRGKPSLDTNTSILTQWNVVCCLFQPGFKIFHMFYLPRTILYCVSLRQMTP